jgi:hypothetical protein
MVFSSKPCRRHSRFRVIQEQKDVMIDQRMKRQARLVEDVIRFAVASQCSISTRRTRGKETAGGEGRDGGWWRERERSRGGMEDGVPRQRCRKD